MIAQLLSYPITRHAAFIGSHIVALSIAYWLWILPLQNYFAERDSQIDSQRVLLTKLEGIAAQENAVQDILRQGRANPAPNQFLAGANDGVIEADLQTRLKTIVETGGAKLSSVLALPPVRSGSLKYIGVRVQLLGTHATLQRTIHAVEAAKPFLFVLAATLKSSAATMQPSTTTEPLIDAQLDIFGALETLESKQ